MHIRLQKLHASHCCFALFNNQPKMDDPKSECHANQFRRYANPLGCQPLEIWTIPNQNATPINSGDTQTHLVAKHVKSQKDAAARLANAMTESNRTTMALTCRPHSRRDALRHLPPLVPVAVPPNHQESKASCQIRNTPWMMLQTKA